MLRAGAGSANARIERELAEARERQAAKDAAALAALSPLRLRARQIATSSWFNSVSIALILAFSVLLAFADPLQPVDEGPNRIVHGAEKVFTVIFTVEVLVVWTSEGLLNFFCQAWNVLDIAVVGIGWLAFGGGDSGLNVSRPASSLLALYTPVAIGVVACVPASQPASQPASRARLMPPHRRCCGRCGCYARCGHSSAWRASSGWWTACSSRCLGW
jgi:hypothetical protein